MEVKKPSVAGWPADYAKFLSSGKLKIKALPRVVKNPCRRIKHAHERCGMLSSRQARISTSESSKS